MRSAMPIPGDQERRHAVRAWLSRPAGLGWELAAILSMAVISASLLVAAFRHVLPMLYLPNYHVCHGFFDAPPEPGEKHLDHFGGHASGCLGAAPGPSNMR